MFLPPFHHSVLPRFENNRGEKLLSVNGWNPDRLDRLFKFRWTSSGAAA